MLDFTLPQFGFIVATRGALGLGAGLLLAGKLERDRRRQLGAVLFALGVLTTIPALGLVWRQRRDAMRGG